MKQNTNMPPYSYLPILSPKDILRKGFHFHNRLLSNFTRAWTEQRTDECKSFYGSSPVVLDSQWYTMDYVDLLDLGLTKADQTDKGLSMFFVAHHFL
jgi:hypothetical protein